MLHSSPRRGGVGVDRLAGSDYERWFVEARRLAQTQARAEGPPVKGKAGAGRSN